MRNCHFRQNRQAPRGHFWHPIQIASGWRFFASFAIACISGHECFSLELRRVFEGTTRVYERICRFQLQMNKKEREICEFEMNFKKYFVCGLI